MLTANYRSANASFLEISGSAHGRKPPAETSPILDGIKHTLCATTVAALGEMPLSRGLAMSLSKSEPGPTALVKLF